MKVMLLGAMARPNFGGIYTIIKPVIESLIRYGTFDYVLETHSSQSDIEQLARERGLSIFNSSDSDSLTKFSLWFDGGHPRFSIVDKVRDIVYEKIASDWSLGKHMYCKQLSRSGSDVYHSLCQGIPFWPEQKRIVYVASAYDFQPEYFPEFWQDEKQKKLIHNYAVYRNASAVCVLGETVKDEAIRFAGVDPERIFVTPLGPWPMPPPSDDIFREEMRRKHNLPPRFMFYPAYTRVAKNHQTLIKAIAALKQKNCPVTLVTTGKQEPHYSYLKKLMSDLKVEDNIVFTDFIGDEEMSALYDMADFVVLPTLFEGATGIPLLEAATKGKAIAAARICEIPNAVGENGIIFDPHSVSEIASAVEKLWCDHEARTHYENKSSEIIRHRSWKNFTEQCEKAYSYAHNNPK